MEEALNYALFAVAITIAVLLSEAVRVLFIE